MLNVAKFPHKKTLLCDSLELSLQTLNTFFTEFKPKMEHHSSGYLPYPDYAPNFYANAISGHIIFHHK